ncbi:MAG: aldo/keto reductase [Anaerolineae bacterium]|nr:aldo/keto reductase [Anaerolineae bacterium]
MIPQLAFGRTGHLSTRTIFGGAALGGVTQDDADRTLDVLLEYGINHIDTAASYGDSELRIGPWMAQHRNDFFLATKTGERTYQAARDELHRSLDRLHVSSVDLIQLHYLVDPQEWEVAMGPGGALEAVIEAREQGLTRYIGVTGHDVVVAGMHKRSLERFDFDSVLLPYNYIMMQNPEYAADFETLTTMCRVHNVAVQTIKGITRSPWQEGQARTTTTWYAPLTDQPAIDRAVWWVLGNPQVFLNTASDIHMLPKILDAASRFEARPSDGEMEADVATYQMAPLFT